MKKILKCAECSRCCELIVNLTENDADYPVCCPYESFTVWHEVKEETLTNCNQLPKLTVDVFDRPDCPAWAKYATVDKDGRGFYYHNKPQKNDYNWGLSDIVGCKLIGDFDPSDWENSLVERPAKALPDWCQVKAIGYDNDQKRYFKITTVSESCINIKYLDVDVNDITEGCVPYQNIKDFSEARKRPFNEKELKALVGKVIEKGPSTYLVSGFENVFENECMVHVNGCMYSGNDLMKHEYTVDGKPCYKLEYQNDEGEWVK